MSKIELPTISGALQILNKPQGEGFQLSDWRVVRMVAELSEPANAMSDGIRTSQNYQIVADGGIAVRTEFSTAVIIQSESSESPRKPMACMMSFGLGATYRFNGEVPTVDRVVVAKALAVMHAWSYWRTFVYTSMAQMQLKGNLVPLIQIPDAVRMAGFPEDPQPSVDDKSSPAD